MSLTIPRKSLSSLKEMSLAEPIFGKFWGKRHQGIHVFLTSQGLDGPLVPRIAWAGKNPIDLVDSEAIRGGSGHHVCLETTRQAETQTEPEAPTRQAPFSLIHSPVPAPGRALQEMPPVTSILSPFRAWWKVHKNHRKTYSQNWEMTNYV